MRSCPRKLTSKQGRTIWKDAFAKVCASFNIEKLNRHQEDLIKYVVQNKRDVFVNLPTRFGKSLTYEDLPVVF